MVTKKQLTKFIFNSSYIYKRKTFLATDFSFPKCKKETFFKNLFKKINVKQRIINFQKKKKN